MTDDQLDQETWLAYGIQHRYITPVFCATHDSLPLTALEWDQFDDGDDPCLAVVRIIDDERRVALEVGNPEMWIGVPPPC